jgi:Flp pilus assembly protein TadG
VKRRRRSRGQALVEFAIVIWWFLLLLFGAVAAALHSLQREVAETAASVGVQAAASADRADPANPNLGAAYAPTHRIMQPVMFGTTIVDKPVGSQCDPPGTAGTLEVCVYQNGNLVVERVSGRPQYVIPYLAQWLNFSIDITLGVRQVTYQR